MSTNQEAGSNYRVRQLTPDECIEHVQELANLLVPAFAKAAGEIDVWSALKLCALGEMQCFVGEVNSIVNAAMITAFTTYPNLKVCDVVAYAGKARNFYWFNQELEDWALRNGADEMRGYGTEATMRLARRHGYQEVYRVYKKPLKRKEVE